MSNEFSINLGLDIVPQSKDPENLGDLYRLYNAAKSLASALDAYTGAVGAAQEDWAIAGTEYLLLQRMARIYIPFAVAITPGQIVGVNTSGNAILAATGAAVGWSPGSVAAGAWGEVRLFGLHTAVAGLTPGVSYYSSVTPGAITATVTAQKIGFAIASNKLFFNPA